MPTNVPNPPEARQTSKDHFKYLKLLLYPSIPMSFVTGILMQILGMRSMKFFGAQLRKDQYLDPAFNSTFRYVAIFWFGVACFTPLYLSDVPRYAKPLRVMLWLTCAGGAMRLITFAEYGFAGNSLGVYFPAVVTVLEFITGGFGLLLLRKGLRDAEKDS